MKILFTKHVHESQNDKGEHSVNRGQAPFTG